MMIEARGLGSVRVAAATLRPLGAIMTEAELDRGAVLEAAHLPDTLLDAGHEDSVSLADYYRLTEQIALAIGDETVHVSARPLMLGTSDFIRDRLRNATTVRGMLDILAESYNVIHGGRYNRVAAARDTLSFVMDDSDFPYAIARDDAFILFSLEALLIYVHVLLQSSSTADAPLPVRSLRTRREKDAAPSPLAAWGVPLVHGAPHFAIHYDEAVADWPVDPARCSVLGSRTIYGGIARTLDSLDTADPLVGDIVQRTVQALRDGLGDQHAVARHLGMSVASLRRRLEERGATFRDLRAKTLAQEAKLRLEQGRSVAAIAEELGFSDGRSFARAFRSWTGLSPRRYRRGTGD
ncbi:AraC family transcriptional regulator [Parasphingopyxis sp.]|uniref:AraC family transcriptional regulator n=1 Tax=Parasphingopyxis sp. TaxID=1920299 RepID=UPI002605E779|nr:AraC family transcriptional regulator [Parasphingopyxis sp.]